MFRRARSTGDFSDEIQSHIAMLADRLQAEGMSPEAARAAALREFGNRTASAERFFEASPAAPLDALLRDLRYAARVLRRNPAFTLVAVLSLALGIGANTAIFQLVDAVRLRLLPVSRPEELVRVRLASMEKVRGSRAGGGTLTWPIWHEIQTRQRAFSEFFAWAPAGFDLATEGEPRIVDGMLVSGSFFPSLAIQPVAGRLFQESDDQPGCGLSTAVISYAFWQRQFGGQPGAVGSMLNVNHHLVQVVGITPASFFGMEVGRSFDVAVPVCAQGTLRNSDLARLGTYWWLTAMGRLRPGWTAERASAYFGTISQQVFAQSLPANYPPVSIKDYLALSLVAEPAGRGVSDLREEYSRPLWLLLAIAGLVLLIACANLANLMLARASARGREIAVRLAIGASRGRLVRQLMAESLLIALLGAAIGLIAARSLSAVLVSLLSTPGNMVFINLDRDWRVLAFAAALALLTALLFGLAPALRATRAGFGEALRSGGRGATAAASGPFGLRRLLVVLQVALSLVLLVAALLFTGTLRNLSNTRTGFRPEGVLVAQIGFGSKTLDPPRLSALRQDLQERLRAIPGVAAAGDTDNVPLSGASTSNSMWIEGDSREHGHECWRAHIGPGYFEALAMPLLAGRPIDARDTAMSPKVAVVNEAFARALTSGQNPVGRHVWVEATPFEPSQMFEIVGLVGNTKYEELREAFQPILFQAQAQNPAPAQSDSYLIRSHLPMESLVPAVRAVLTDTVPGVRYRFRMFESAIRDTLVQERLMASLSLAFGILAGVLAAMGLYGVMSYLVARRRNEIGIRMALGASRFEIVAMVLRESGLLLAAGLASGAVLSLLSTRAIVSLLFGMEAVNLTALLTGAGILAAVALAASVLPARRAANLDPNAALREE